MTDYTQAQDVFSKGELAPSMYARVSLATYYKGLKVAKNILPIPQGGARKRFGTKYRATLGQIDYKAIRPAIFEFGNECVYQVIFYDDTLDIILEGRVVATVGSTGIDSDDVNLIDETVLENVLRICVGFQAPRDLVRSAGSANTISAVDVSDNFITLDTAITDDIILPVRFTTTGTLPTSTPQIKTGRTYFIRALSTTTAAVYLTPIDARDDINRLNFSAAGSDNNMVPLNNWSFSAITFSNFPVYDFDGGYDAITFTPSATSGSVTLTASSAIFTAAHVGGLFVGAGGIARITAFSSGTSVTVLTIEDFSSTSGIPGRLALLAEPAWSDARGWPKKCSSYQNRSVFANTELLPNGTWLSAINDYLDFDDSTLDDDQAISWYPTSDFGNYIKYITPFRSLVIHTDSGIYSTPMTNEFAITPRTFALTLQDNTPSADIEPVIIDNQIFVVSGVDVNSLLWEFNQNSYTPGLVSAISEHLIVDPISMASFQDKNTSGGRYVFIVNSDGSLAMYQTLISEQVSGWTWAETKQSYGDSYFRYVLANTLGRCWFICEREKATAQTLIDISGFDADDDTLTATGSNLSTTEATAVVFYTTDSLPATNPQIELERFYWAIGVDADTFKIYNSKEDAQNDENQIDISGAGTNSTVEPYLLSTALTLEELSYDVFTDCTVEQSGTDLTTATNLTLFDAQDITVKADGRVYDSNPVISNETDITILGEEAEVNNIQSGYAIESKIVPLPLSIALGRDANTSNLAVAKHIRNVSFMFSDTVGGKINEQNIALNNLKNQSFNAPVGQLGLMKVSIMKGWNQFQEAPFEITHKDPYQFNLLGLFYQVTI